MNITFLRLSDIDMLKKISIVIQLGEINIFKIYVDK